MSNTYTKSELLKHVNQNTQNYRDEKYPWVRTDTSLNVKPSILDIIAVYRSSSETILSKSTTALSLIHQQEHRKQ